MIHLLSNLKSYIFQTIFKNQKKGPEYNNKTNYCVKKNEVNESSFTLSNGINGYITNNLLLLSTLPCLYLYSSILVIIILLYLKNSYKIEFSSDIKLGNLKIPNFYDLQKVSPIVYNSYITISSFTGFAIVMILYSVLKQRFKVPEYQVHSFKLNIMMIFGIISNIINFSRTIFPSLMDNYFMNVKQIEPELEINLNHIIFLSFVFFAVLFSLHSICIINYLKEKNNEFFEKQIGKNKWYLYKFITLSCLCIFTLIYILFLLHNYQIIDVGQISNFLKTNHMAVISIFPYFIHVINSILMFSFYFELKFVNLALSQNLDVDYLFVEEKFIL